MLSIISLIALLLVGFYDGVNGQGGQSMVVNARDALKGSLFSFCNLVSQEQQQQLSTTCVIEDVPYPLSSSLDQFCTYFDDDDVRELSNCRAVFGKNGGAPYPAAPGYDNRPKEQVQQTIILKLQPNGQPIFFNQQTQQPFYIQKPTSRVPGAPVFTFQTQPVNPNPQIVIGNPAPQPQPTFVIGNPQPQPRPVNPAFVIGNNPAPQPARQPFPFVVVGQPGQQQPQQPTVIQVPGGQNPPPQQGGGQVVVVNQPGKESQVIKTEAGGDPNKPIVLNINVQGDGSGVGGSGSGSGSGGAGGRGPIKIGAQANDERSPTSAPQPPAEEDLTALVFKGDGPDMVTRCPPNTPITWAYKTWTEGHIRPYYENYGPKSSLEDCIKVCESKEECFFATFPLATRQCWLLTSTHPERCNYHTGPHYGQLLEPCSPAQPCPSAYKRCAKPSCWLQSIVNNFCKSGSKRQAVTACHA